MKKIISTLLLISITILVFSLPAMAKNDVKYPKALQPGDTIAITSPSASRKLTTGAIDKLRQNGYDVRIEATNTKEYGYFAGTDAERAAELNALFADPEVDAILCMRGGYGSSRILDLLDYDTIAKNPKLLIGFSDITALHAAIFKKTGIVTVHGPVISTLETASDYTWNQFLLGLQGQLYPGPVSMPTGYAAKTVSAGTASGRLVGGNLTVLMSLMGTQYQPDFNNSILFVEDTGESGYRIDRMMYQLYQSGVLSQVNGIVFGEFLNPGNSISLESIMQYYAALSGKPCIKGMPIGHGKNNAYIPVGAQAIIQANEDGSAALMIDMPESSAN